MQTKQLKRIKTGIPGLDRILAGGLFETGVYIVQGGAGAGKTIFANQICFHYARDKRRALYYTLLTEAHDRMLSFLSRLSFFDEKQLPDALSYVSGFKLLETEGLPGVIRNVRDMIARDRPSIVVIDGLVSAEEIAPNNTAFKKFLHEIQTVSAMFTCTVLLLTNTEAATRLQAEHTMVDGIIELKAEVVGLKARRTLEVSKMRGSGQLRGTHTLEINEDGITVRPRIEAVLREFGFLERPTNQDERRPFGVAGLDKMLGGGLTASSNTMLMGPSGVGKTVLGMHFVNAAAEAGEKALFFTFYERPEEIYAKAKRFGMEPLVKALEAKTVRIVWQSTVEANIDRIGSDLIHAFDELRPKRVFLDGVHGFEATLDHRDRIQDFFAAIADFFMGHGATFMFTAETEDIIGEPVRPPFPNASRTSQNIILLRYAELRAHLAKVVAIVKMRDSDFDRSLYELVVGERGVVVDGKPVEADQLLRGQPLRVRTESVG
jgi:circadian clock protein KaiC